MFVQEQKVKPLWKNVFLPFSCRDKQDKCSDFGFTTVELDHLLGKFFKDVRKINGVEYEPSTLTGLQITAPPASKCQVPSNHTAS